MTLSAERADNSPTFSQASPLASLSLAYYTLAFVLEGIVVDFGLSDEQQLTVDSLRAFAVRELLPKYTYWDRHSLFPREQWLKMGQLGVLGLRVRPE